MNAVNWIADLLNVPVLLGFRLDNGNTLGLSGSVDFECCLPVEPTKCLCFTLQRAKHIIYALIEVICYSKATWAMKSF